jgi:rSAM/selenodomain-associated transferase 2
VDQNNHKFSVIIPTLNEEDHIGARIDEIRNICPVAQVIVADGGSADRTQEIAQEKCAAVVVSPKGRGTQCNAGAKVATGDIMLFLHADTILPHDAFIVLDKFFQDRDTHIGTFRLKFDLDHFILSVDAFCTRLDCVFTRFGDRCITIRKFFFDKLGGFPELEYFEDVELLQKARKFTGIRLFPATVVTSGRRFKEQGVARQYFFDAWLMIQYFLGVSPQRLSEKYANFRKPRKSSGA